MTPKGRSATSNHDHPKLKPPASIALAEEVNCQKEVVRKADFKAD
ncbi:hypothetical protein LMG32289_00669 [Cupriavidus pampae]|uniref:Uncharacterized protein n=1 Tax=Cupriavidus pampae TaxID=659251 RepID=A0ABN7XTK1_9BURK|nr:hypothetical protein LMG32289_00669 [Cupriavidus pampae]